MIPKILKKITTKPTKPLQKARTSGKTTTKPKSETPQPKAEHIATINKLLNTSFKPDKVYSWREIDSISRIFIANNMKASRFTKEGKAIGHFRELSRTRLEKAYRADGTIGVLKMYLDNPEYNLSRVVQSAMWLLKQNGALETMFGFHNLNAKQIKNISDFGFDTVITSLYKDGKLSKKMLRECKRIYNKL